MSSAGEGRFAFLRDPRSAFRSLSTIMSTAVRADPWRAGAVLLIHAVEGMVRAGFALWLRFLLDGVIGRDESSIITAAAGYGTSLAALGVLNLARINLGTVLVERTGFLLDQRLIQLTTGIATLEHHERADYANELALLRQQRGALSSTVQVVASNVLMFSTLLSGIGLMTSVHPVLAVLPLFALPSLAASNKAVALHQRAAEQTVEGLRTGSHLFKLATTAGPAKELRIFGLGDDLVERHASVWDEHDVVARRAATRAALISSAGWFVFAAGYIAASFIVVLDAVNHPERTSPGEVLMAFTLASSINGFVAGAAANVAWLGTALKTVGRLLWLSDFADEHRVSATEDLPDRIEHGITFYDVTFRYPGTETDVLKDVNLHFPAGATVAIVGDNGAGKTTLVKLLCRFYEPTDGTIGVDGIDLASVDPSDWRSSVAGGFQDFARFELLARENVGVGDVGRVDDADAVTAALERAHASDVPASLPAGLETQLGKSFTDGVDLSTGQWQKLALGRAMMREAPLLLVLDEPTASLDAETEHALFERYAGAAERVAATNGAITVLVSHRFSTVRMADLIVVIDGGRVVENGTHSELITRGGLYAELFELQARSYR